MFNNHFSYPGPGAFGRLINALANGRELAAIRRAVLSRLPFLTLASDVTDVVYLTWLVPTHAVRDLIPNGMTVREADGQTLLTALTYRHHHFGPSFAGPLRRLFPSPRQSNWRLYAQTMPDGSSADKVVLFIKNIFDSRLHALGTRLFSDALPSHFAPRFTHERTATGYRTVIDGGTGSAPGLSSEVEIASAKVLPDAFKPFFDSWQSAVEYLALQDSALSEVAGIHALAHAGIALPIDIDAIVPAVAKHVSPGAFLLEHGAHAPALCFVVPAVHFKVLWERIV